jgi:RimJ/RimL family protein N-acetyltransferase
MIGVEDDLSMVADRRHDQMLRLVAKSFYKELINYGVRAPQVVTVAAHLLDNLLQKTDPRSEQTDFYNKLFTIGDVENEWTSGKCLSLQGVSVRPLSAGLIPQIAAWLRVPAIRDAFYPRFPASEEELRRHVQAEARAYFSICYQEQPIGLIGAEEIDLQAGKVEMRKLVGDPGMHGKGIGKRATFLFLYYAFMIRGFNKVYIHSLDVNVRNLNLNSKFGFELEGTLFEDALVQNTRRDVVRMGLRASVWKELFT